MWWNSYIYPSGDNKLGQFSFNGYYFLHYSSWLNCFWEKGMEERKDYVSEEEQYILKWLLWRTVERGAEKNQDSLGSLRARLAMVIRNVYCY